MPDEAHAEIAEAADDHDAADSGLDGDAGARCTGHLVRVERPLLERVEARRLVLDGERAEQRLARRAVVLRARTARMEAAALGRVDRVRDVSCEDERLAAPAAARVRDRDGREQRAGVRMPRGCIEVVGRRELDELPQVHHGDAVGDVPDDAQVVGDEDVREAELALQVLEQVEDLRLHGDVERGDRLVRHDELGIERERAGDADPLALPARELVREPVVVLRVEADDLEQVLHTPLPLGVRADPVHLERLGDDEADALARVEGCVGVLEDHLDLAAHAAAARPGTAG